MTPRKPLVLVGGDVQQLQAGDVLEGNQFDFPNQFAGIPTPGNPEFVVGTQLGMPFYLKADGSGVDLAIADAAAPVWQVIGLVSQIGDGVVTLQADGMLRLLSSQWDTLLNQQSGGLIPDTEYYLGSIVVGYSNAAQVLIYDVAPATNDVTIGISTISGDQHIPVGVNFTLGEFGDLYTVTDSNSNEFQKIAASWNSGTFTVTFDGQTTDPIAFDASAGDVQSALEALSNVEPGDVNVVLLNTSVWQVEFTGQYADTDVPEMTADPNGSLVTLDRTTLQEGATGFNEIERITVTADGGTFHLFFNINPDDEPTITDPIAYNADAATVQAALEGLSNIDPGDVSVTLVEQGVWDIEYTGALAETDVQGSFPYDIDLTGAPNMNVVTFFDGGHTNILTFTPSLSLNLPLNQDLVLFSGPSTPSLTTTRPSTGVVMRVGYAVSTVDMNIAPMFLGVLP